VIPLLRSGQVFVDLNSAAPAVKKQIGEIKRPEGVLYCDAAVMNTVPGNNHKVKIFLSGDGAESFHYALKRYGMNLTDLKMEAGGSSAIKMFRSVFMKGLPQLMIEAMLPAMEYDALDELIESLNGSLRNKSIEDLADVFFARTMIHAERRSKEMQDVVQTIETMGFDSKMSRSSRDKLVMLSEINFADELGPEGNEDFRAVLKILREKRRKE